MIPQGRLCWRKGIILRYPFEVASISRPKMYSVYVKSLVSLSDIILFSGAIPFQGGRNHVNEQWPHYWYRLFQEYGYDCLDVFRKTIWNDKRIQPWYKQNILLFMKKELVIERRFERFVENTPPLALVHPGIFIPKMEQTITVKRSMENALEGNEENS